MTEDHIPTALMVEGTLRKLNSKAIPHYITHKGAYGAGTVIVKIILRQGLCRLLNQTRDIDGKIAWMNVFDVADVDETRADGYIKRSITRDPDVWVIEVEDKTGENPFEGKVL